jgi:putative membrane protein
MASVQHEQTVEASTHRQEASTNRQEDSADRRTVLAANRTVFAAERTYAAWVRTALVALASGVGAKATLKAVVPEWIILVAGTVLVLFSAFCFAAAVWREIDTGAAPPRPEVRRIPRALLIAVNVLLGLVSLSALLGIWFGQTR